MISNLKENISLWQLFILIFIFEIGSAAIVGIGNDAGQDAWIAVLVATLFGVGIAFFYYFLLSKKKGSNLFEIFEFCFGKVLSKVFIFGYIVYFFYIAARVLRDFGELMVSTIFEKTPIEFISVSMMLAIMYMLYLGLEVLGRTSEIFLPYVVSFILLVGFFILISGEIHFEHLLPILGDGIRPISKAIFPQLLTFPFGELIAFMIIIPHVTKFKLAGKVSMFSIILSGFFLTFSSLVQVTTLGADIKGRANFPLLSAAREISLWNFLERVDLVVVFVVMFGIIVKVSVFFFGGLKGLELIFSLPYRVFIFPMGALIAFVSIAISHNFAEHIEEGLVFVPFYLHLPFQFGIPLLVLPILLWKTKQQPKKVKKSE